MSNSKQMPEDCRLLADIGLRDEMTTGGIGVDCRELIGRSVVASLPIPDSDRAEELILCSDGFVLCVSCDPGYEDDDVTRTDDKWDVCLYDATDTDAGRLMREHFAALCQDEY